jgi:DNA polymerase-3 subunit beta
MKLTASTKQLSAAIKTVLPAVATRPRLPLLSGVRIDASEEGPALEATDLELSIRHHPGEGISVERPGSAVVPAKALAKAVQSAPGSDVQLESASHEGRTRLQVRSGSRVVTLEGYAPEDWLANPGPSDLVPVAEGVAPALAEAFRLAALCASKDEMRPTLTGVALFFGEGSSSLEVVATDSYRLGVVPIPLTGIREAPERSPLLPARVARALAKQLKGLKETVRIGVAGPDDSTAPLVGFSFAGSMWCVRTIEGEYRAWRQVVPEAEGGLLEFDAAELESALRASISVRGTRGASVRLSLDRSCSLALADPDFGTVEEGLAGVTFSPNGAGPLQVTFNSDYLLDAIRFVGGERARMWIRDALKPALFEWNQRRYALMPIRNR